MPTRGFLVLGRNADSAANGGVAVNYLYRSFTSGNSTDVPKTFNPYTILEAWKLKSQIPRMSHEEIA